MTELFPAMALPTLWQAKLTGTLNGVMARTTPHGSRKVKPNMYMWTNDFVDFRDVDRAWMKFTGREDRNGPFGMMDSVGLDVIYDIEMVYYRNSKDPKDHPPP